MSGAIDFIHDIRFELLPADVVQTAKRAVLDLIGVAAAGAATDLSDRHRFAANNLCAAKGGARMLFDGRQASATRAAFAGASTIDSFDAHDGHRLTKGHAGVALLPALLALIDNGSDVDGPELLTALVVGYEIATRAGIALHASVSDYHTSGAWNALGVAAIGARLRSLSPAATRHALGIAEYHGPRSQMMRCIDHPTMVKDGSGYGALAGLSALVLAAAGFTGAPAILLEAEDQQALWGDLGQRWFLREQYFKPYPVCRWAQPAIEAVAGLLGEHALAPETIAGIEIATFAAAVRLGTARPMTTEEAQYALGFPVAAYLARGKLGPDEISGDGLADPTILAMLDRIHVVEDETLTARFPAERLARVTILLRSGSVHQSLPTSARGDPENPLGDAELHAKFELLAAALGSERIPAITGSVAALDGEGADTAALLDAGLLPIPSARSATVKALPLATRMRNSAN